MEFNPLNPLYLKGFNDGEKASRKKSIEHFEKGIDALQKMEGIGPKTMEKVAEAFGLEYEWKTVEKVKK